MRREVLWQELSGYDTDSELSGTIAARKSIAIREGTTCFSNANGLPTKGFGLRQGGWHDNEWPMGARMVQQSFETALSDPDNEYFKLDFENKNKFGANTLYQQSKQALMQRYAKNDFLSDAGIAPKHFVYEPGQQYTRPLAGGGSKKKEVVFTQGPQTFLTVGQIPTTVKKLANQIKQWPHSNPTYFPPLFYFSAPVKEVPLEISLTLTETWHLQVAKGTSGSYTVATDNIGVTAQPFTTAKIQSGDKSFKPGIGLNIANLRNQLGKGPYTVTYSDGTKETIATLPALLNSKAVQFDPMYVFTLPFNWVAVARWTGRLQRQWDMICPLQGTKAVLDKKIDKGP